MDEREPDSVEGRAPVEPVPDSEEEGGFLLEPLPRPKREPGVELPPLRLRELPLVGTADAIFTFGINTRGFVVFGVNVTGVVAVGVNAVGVVAVGVNVLGGLISVGMNTLAPLVLIGMFSVWAFGVGGGLLIPIPLQMHPAWTVPLSLVLATSMLLASRIYLARSARELGRLKRFYWITFSGITEGDDDFDERAGRLIRRWQGYGFALGAAVCLLSNLVWIFFPEGPLSLVPFSLLL